jgi:adenylate cyclase
MAEEKFKRKLTAILSADVAGYSRLMAEDESATVKTLEAYREVMSTLIMQHRGRVIDSPGDNLLAEFTSVVDAVQCAVAVQKEFQARNAELPENRRMEFRIGVNLGDVIEEGERIYGDGVNIAARLEALADPGGICISKTAFDQIETKLPLGYEYLGEQEVKNIPKPVAAYRVLLEPRVTVAKAREQKKAWPGLRRAIFVGAVAVLILAIAVGIWEFYLRPAPLVGVASVEKMAFPLPDEPSITVIPFKNLSGDPEQEYFSDGLTRSIITQLYKIPNMFVIHRDSSFAYKGKKVTLQQVAEEMGVRYVLEGSVQKAGNRVRVNVLLIDAVNGRQLWAESYDRELKDVFDVQDEITRKVATEMAVKVSWGEQARGWTRMTENHEALDLFYQADKIFMRYEKESNAKARELLIKAIELDPKFARAIAFLGYTHLLDAMYGWLKNRTRSINKAEELAKRALTIDDTVYLAHSLLSSIYANKRLYEEAIAAAERGVEAEPNNAMAISVLAYAKINAGKYGEGLDLMRKVMRLAPHPPQYFYPPAVYANYLTGRYETAITPSKKFLKRQQHGTLALILWHWLIASYMELGREEEAQAEAQRLLEQHPNTSIEGYTKRIKRLSFKDFTFLDRQTELLRKAGLPETPSLPLPDKPSIAVLPFVNMSGDPEQEYFSDGISEQIITSLSMVSDLFVIARTSSFKYKGKEVDVRRVGRELGVRYVLEGSVQKSGDRVRITAQLIDAKSGNHLWAERYDRDLKDIFELQDEIAMKILTALRVKLTSGEQARVHAKGANNITAYLKFLKGREYLLRFNPGDNLMARQMFKEAIALDPQYPGAYSLLAHTHLNDIFLRSTKSPSKSIKKATELVQKALALDDSLPPTIAALGRIFFQKRQPEKALAEYERSVSLNPNSAGAHAWLGLALNSVGRPDEAIASIKKAIRLNPISPAWFFRILGDSYRMIGRYEDSIAAYKKALDRKPNSLFPHLGLTATYSMAGRLDEARAQATEVLRVQPKFSLKRFVKRLNFKDKAERDRYVDALRKAGLK